MKANKIVLNTEQDEDPNAKSDEESSFSEASEDDNQKDIYGDLFEKYPSDLEDLLELEKIEQQRRQEKRMQRRTQRGEQYDENGNYRADEDQDDESGSEELDGPLATVAGVKKNRLKAIQLLIEKKKQKKGR